MLKTSTKNKTGKNTMLPCTHLYSETCTFFDSHSSLFFFRLFPLFSGSRTPLILSLFLHFTVPDAFNFLLLLFFFYPADKNSLAVPTAFPTPCSSFPQTRSAGNRSELCPHFDRRKPEHRIAILVSSSGFSSLPSFSFMGQETDGVFFLMRCRKTA